MDHTRYNDMHTLYQMQTSEVTLDTEVKIDHMGHFFPLKEVFPLANMVFEIPPEFLSQQLPMG